MDARHRARRRGVDRRGSWRGACGLRTKAGVQRAGQLHVVDEPAAPGQQRRIFEARDPRAEMLRAHDRMSRNCATPRPTIHRKHCIAIATNRTLAATRSPRHEHARCARRCASIGTIRRRTAARFPGRISPRWRRRACCCASTGRSTRTPSCIRWCAGSSRAASPRSSGARSCSPTWSTRPAAATTCRSRSARWRPRRASMRSAWDVRSRRSRRRGSTRSPIRSRRSRVASPPCQEVVIKGDELRGAGNGLARAAGADLDARLRRRAVSHRDALRHPRSRNRHPEHGHLPRRAEGDRPARRAHGLAHRRRRRLSALAEVQQARRADAVRDRHRLRAGRDVHRPQKLADRSGRDGGRRRARRRADPDGEGRHRRSRRAGRRRDRDRGPDRSRAARAGRAVRREPRPRRARGLQHVDAGDGDHPQASAGVRLDHQPGDAERIERAQEGGLSSRCSWRICAIGCRSRACAAW